MYEKLDVGPPHVLGYEVAGTLTESDYEQAAQEVRDAIDEHGTINMLVRAPDTPEAEMESGKGPLDFLFDHDDHVGRVAVVGEDQRVKWLTRLGKTKIAPKVKRFDLDDEEAARDWVADS